MEYKIRRLYYQDCIVISAFTIFLWSVLIYIMTSIKTVISDKGEHINISGTGLIYYK